MKGIQNTFSRLVQHEGKKLRGDDTSVGSNEFKVTSTRMLLTLEGCISLCLKRHTVFFLPSPSPPFCWNPCHSHCSHCDCWTDGLDTECTNTKQVHTHAEYAQRLM